MFLCSYVFKTKTCSYVLMFLKQKTCSYVFKNKKTCSYVLMSLKQKHVIMSTKQSSLPLPSCPHQHQ